MQGGEALHFLDLRGDVAPDDDLEAEGVAAGCFAAVVDAAHFLHHVLLGHGGEVEVGGGVGGLEEDFVVAVADAVVGVAGLGALELGGGGGGDLGRGLLGGEALDELAKGEEGAVLAVVGAGGVGLEALDGIHEGADEGALHAAEVAVDALGLGLAGEVVGGDGEADDDNGEEEAVPGLEPPAEGLEEGFHFIGRRRPDVAKKGGPRNSRKARNGRGTAEVG